MTTPGDSSSTGAYSVGAERPKRRFPWWLLALLALLLLALLLLALSQCGTDDEPTPPVAVATVSAAPSEEPASPEPTTPPEPTVSAEPTTPPTDGGVGSAPLTAGGTALLPLDEAAGPGGDLSEYVGQPAEGRGVTVQSVPADEGFWVGDSESDRVWVQLIGKAGESDYEVEKGDTVDLDGEVVETPSGFAEEVGVDGSEGAEQLEQQKAHIETEKSSVKLNQ